MDGPAVLVSLCLMGIDCRYDGGSNPCDLDRLAARWPERFDAVLAAARQLISAVGRKADDARLRGLRDPIFHRESSFGFLTVKNARHRCRAFLVRPSNQTA